MKIKLLKPLIWLAAFIIIALALNIQVSTKQGINYKVKTIRIPLYLKILDFFDRNYNYKFTVKRIISGSKAKEDKVLKIFRWTHENIKKTPESFPVIDDHVWHVIVRGYGEDDQSADVFTTLCNYAGIDAFFSFVYTKKSGRRLTLSFVKIKGRWGVFDSYNGIYFKNNKNDFADAQDIVKGNWLMEKIDITDTPNFDYSDYFKNLLPINDIELKRANIQSPINRLKFELKKYFR